MDRHSPRQRKLSSSTPQKKSNYYAGARFETRPSMTSLPPPPPRWTASSPLPRSQSMPSSPITTNMMGIGFGSGERRPATTPPTSTVFKSASFPGDSSLLGLFRVRESSNAQEEQISIMRPRPPSPVKVVEEKVDLIQMLIQASPRKEERELSPVKLIPRSIARQSCGQEYKDITNHLKSLLNVSA